MVFECVPRHPFNRSYKQYLLETLCSMSEKPTPSSSENVGQAAVQGVNTAASIQQPTIATDGNAEIEGAEPIEIDEAAGDSGYGESDA